MPSCTLKWRQGKLLVSLAPRDKQPYLPSIESEQWLVDCLKHSPVRLIRIDPDLGESWLKLWADACEQANKAVFLRLPSARELPRWRWWWLKRLIDWSAAAVLLLALSPVMLVLVLLMHVYSPGPIFLRQWYVGERGKLFRVFKFRTTGLERLMRKYSLDALPQLLNVVRGEMSLVGPRPWTLDEAVRLSPEGRQQLNKLPGIIGAKQVEAS